MPPRTSWPPSNQAIIRVVFVGAIFACLIINNLSFVELEQEHLGIEQRDNNAITTTSTPARQSRHNREQLLRSVVGEVQAQVNFTLHNYEFVYKAATKPYLQWGLSPNSLQEEIGAAEWKFAARAEWAPVTADSSSSSSGGGNERSSRQPRPFDLSDEAMYKCLRDGRIFMAGTSYQRNMYWAAAKLLKHNAYLDEAFRMLSPSPLSLAYGERLCSNDPLAIVRGTAASGDVYCYKVSALTNCRPGLLRSSRGVDVDKCGMPLNSTFHSSELNSTIHFQFKTVLDTPQVDVEIANQITSHPYDSAILGSGEWGRLQKQFQHDDGQRIHPALVPRDVNTSNLDLHAVQAARYLSRILPALESSAVVVLAYCNVDFNRSSREWCNVSKRAHAQYMAGKLNVPVLTFDGIGVMLHNYNHLRLEHPDLPHPGHGYEGPVTEQYARLMLAARCRVRELVAEREAAAAAGTRTHE
jgi:hypothetical protein